MEKGMSASRLLSLVAKLGVRFALCRWLSPKIRYPTATYVATMTAIIHFWLYDPSKIPNGYRVWLDRCCGLKSKDLADVRSDCLERGWPSKKLNNVFPGCVLPCLTTTGALVGVAFGLKMIMKLASGRRDALLRDVRGWARSSLAISSVFQGGIFIAYVWNCVTSAIPPRWLAAVMMIPATMGIAIDSPSRRRAIATYNLVEYGLFILKQVRRRGAASKSSVDPVGESNDGENRTN